jgi:amino acid transporter
MKPLSTPRSAPPPALGVWDTTSIIVGIIVGVGIYEAPYAICRNVPGPWSAMGVWLLGGALSLVGALCFAELATTYPRSGGDYVYLTRAYGSGVGFLFAWAQLAVIRSGGILALIAFIVGDFANRLFHLGPGEQSVDPRTSAVYAVAAIVGLSLIHALGIEAGKRTQNVLTVAKVLGLGGSVVVGLLWARPTQSAAVQPLTTAPVAAGSLALALVSVLFAYGGWSDAAFVAGEVKQRERNLPLALLLGTGLVTAIYLLVNAAFLLGVGFEAMRSSPAAVGSILTPALGPWWGVKVMSALVIVTALGSLHATLWAGSRLYPELGADHPALGFLGHWHARRGAPIYSLAIQAVVSSAMVVGAVLLWPTQHGFEALLKCTAPVFWLFFLLTGLSLFVLRFKDADVVRPFRVPGYPVTPIVFCASCVYMLVGSIVEARQEALVGLLLLAAGLPLYWLVRRWPPPERAPMKEEPAGALAITAARRPALAVAIEEPGKEDL